MDLITHAAMGAAFAALAKPVLDRSQSRPPAEQRLAAGIGALAGLLPDLDALIQSSSDALLVLDYHRYFTHALAFVPIGALLTALLLWPFLRQRINFKTIYVLSLLGYLPHPLLDACTSYGTHLWLPFSQQATAWNLIAVVDPAFTLLLAVPLLLGLRWQRKRLIHLGLLLAAAYFGFAGWQQQRIETAALTVAQVRGHQPLHLVAKPTLGNQVLWRTLYVHEGRVYADAFHSAVTLRHYAGESAALLDDVQAKTLAGGDPARLRDIERFRHFSDGLLVLVSAPGRPQMLGDARYAMLPTSIAPIWGIEWRQRSDTMATDFVVRRDFAPAQRRQFVAMLLGRDG